MKTEDINYALPSFSAIEQGQRILKKNLRAELVRTKKLQKQGGERSEQEGRGTFHTAGVDGQMPAVRGSSGNNAGVEDQPVVVTYIDGERLKDKKSGAEPISDVTVPSLNEKSARVKAMRTLHERKPNNTDPLVLGIASRFG